MNGCKVTTVCVKKYNISSSGKVPPGHICPPTPFIFITSLFCFLAFLHFDQINVNLSTPSLSSCHSWPSEKWNRRECNGLSVCVLHEFLCWNPDGIRRWGLGTSTGASEIRWRHKGEASWMGLEPFLESQKSWPPCVLSAMWQTTRSNSKRDPTTTLLCTPQGLGDDGSGITLLCRLPDLHSSSQTVRNKFLLLISHLVCGVLL